MFFLVVKYKVFYSCVHNHKDYTYRTIIYYQLNCDKYHPKWIEMG